MSTPPLFVAAALLFWGWQTGHWIPAAIAGAALESSRVIKARWSLTQADFNRLWNICSVLFLGLAVVLFINESPVSFNDFLVNAGRRPEAIREAGKSALAWVQWLPMVFLPFMFAQAFNEESRVGLATFSWWLRKQEKLKRNLHLTREKIDVTFAYAALALLAASASTRRNSTFYFGFALLVAWGLWPARTRRYPVLVWMAAFLSLTALGYGGHLGIVRLQKKLEQMDVSWLSRFSGGADSKLAKTAIGSIGHLKLSDRIVLRLRTDDSGPPELLREASFTIFRSPAWGNRDRNFLPVIAEDDKTTWKLLPPKRPGRTVTVAEYLRGGSGLLALPRGAFEIGDLQAALTTNLFGAAWANGAPGLVIFNASYGPGATFDSRPVPDDLRRHDETDPAVAQVAQELGLHLGMKAPEAMQRVGALFADKFQYTTYRDGTFLPTSNETALARFLLHTRAGHCEYFATASALLLREAGVPTRYAIGYAVQEGRGKKYVVRERHAHAWTLVWDGRSWIDFDTTPASWNAIESAHASLLQPLKDFFSDLWFQFSKFRWSKTEWRKYLMLTPVPLLLLVLGRFFLGRQWKKLRGRRPEQRPALVRRGVDSDFYLIEKHFAVRGLERSAGENWSDWLRRIQQGPSLQRVLRLHQRHRFDPNGLNDAERAELRTEVSQWLASQSPR